ncbi:MAG: ABC transporter permease [Alphaproteobacteria bacterium]|nr:ABC transporter permease [Alphaproteobacteria bacterium]
MGSEILGVVLRRILVAIPLMLVVSVLVFVVLRLIPADPVSMAVPPNATAEEVEAVRREMGLHLPIAQQYVIWLGQVVQGDFGRSIAFGQPVLKLIGQSLPATIELAALAAILATVIGLVGGLVMFRLRGGPGEGPADLSSILIMSVPEFLWALFLILLFGVAFNLLPFAGRLGPGQSAPAITGFLLLDCILTGRFGTLASALEHMILPAVALALGTAPLIMRVLRSSLLEVIHEDYIVMARLRGVPERRVITRHAFKNAFLPTLTLMGVQFGFLFGGTLLVEVIYSYPGLGNMMVEAVRNTDLPIIQGAALIYALAVMSINLAVDIAYILLNPKLRASQ